MFTTFRIAILTALLTLACSATTAAQHKAVSDPELAHVLSLVKAADPHLKVEPIPGVSVSSLVWNKAKTRQAYVVCVPATDNPLQCDSLVFVKDKASGTVYKIAGEPGGFERYRPVDELKWVTNDVLSFERWTGPHFGHRFVINIRSKKQTGAFALTG